MEEFSFATGYRIGLNFFRATFKNNIILTAKGYYQSLDKTNNAKFSDANSDNRYTLDLDMINWAVGVDVGWEFTKVISWKIIDVVLQTNNVKLTETRATDAETLIGKYESDGSNISYSIGTGIIVAIFKDYVSIEGLVGYTQISIDDLYHDLGGSFLTGHQLMQTYVSESKFIDSGGFTAVIQLNVGFPLL